MKVTLDFVGGVLAGRRVEFEESGGFTFGRAPDCTSQAPETDLRFSRHHFLIEVNVPNVVLKDLGSLNGTYVNGIKHGGRADGLAPDAAPSSEPIALNDGDRIRAGEHEIVLHVDAPVVCIECDAVIPPADRKAAEFVGGTHLCQVCREREQKKQQQGKRVVAPPAPRPAARPAPKAAADAGGGRRGKLKLDIKQRMKAEEDPAAVLEELLRDVPESQVDVKVAQLGDYRIDRMLGQGGFGAVFLARRERDGVQVALKTLLQTRRASEQQILLFERETLISQQLRHPHIVRCEAAGVCDDVHFIELEYLDGGSVWDLMKMQGKLSIDLARPIVLHVLEALAFAHGAAVTVETRRGRQTVSGVVHRDLKPPNILLTNRGGELEAKVADFGLAKAFSAAGLTKGDLSVGNTVCGSPPYIAPEHVTNYRNVKPPTDVFEAAATFYHMLTGHTVWEPRPGEDPWKVALESTPIPIRNHERTVPKKVADVIDRALSRSPADRYADGGDMLKAMRKAI